MALPWPVVDTHCHVIAPDTARYPLQPMGGKQSDWSRERPVDAAGMIAAMAEAGVAQAVLVQASTCYGHDSSYTRDCVQAQPGRFIGVYSIDLLAPDAVQQAAQWQSQGMAGMRFFVAGHSMAHHDLRLDDPRAEAVWRYASDQGIPVCVQIRAGGLPQLEAVLTRFPQVTVLLDHLARPTLEDGPPYAQADSLWALARFPRLNFKLTTHNFLESAQGRSTPQVFCEAAVRRFGAQRLAWGSNFPASAGGLSHQLKLALDGTATLSDEDRAWIFSGTARRLYPSLGLGPQ
ncbi:MAG: amidohydrolase family protein [Ramlibacter sp.]|jgi:L-fuconolactonase|uniref:amidohydrolase family protein n=1 Tax=Ramlibacter sp. TaxID=1917967 RepID=UPI002606CC7B|nr:amidohydrolase family protein [Ramlibacter sp.]MDH4376797.1 amidohydrolase family protein [Ramlibacter sp.]